MRRLVLPLSLPLLISLSACTCLTEPTVDRAKVQKPIEKVAVPTPRPAEPPAAPAEPEPSVSASHILIAYEGALRSQAKRTKDEAKKFAEELLGKAKGGADFGALAQENSDDPSAKTNRGSLGSFTRGRMVKPFSDAAFALEPGKISDLVETQFGFHIIKREN